MNERQLEQLKKAKRHTVMMDSQTAVEELMELLCRMMPKESVTLKRHKERTEWKATFWATDEEFEVIQEHNSNPNKALDLDSIDWDEAYADILEQDKVKKIRIVTCEDQKRAVTDEETRHFLREACKKLRYHNTSMFTRTYGVVRRSPNWEYWVYRDPEEFLEMRHAGDRTVRIIEVAQRIFREEQGGSE